MDQGVATKLSQFFANGETKIYQKGSLIAHANQDPLGISFLLEGSVEQYDISPSGNKITVNIFKPSAFFPMSWAINKTPNAYYYAALDKTVLQRLPADAVVGFLQDNPDVMLDLLSRVYRGTDALLKRIVVTTSGLATSRLVFDLLIHAQRFGSYLNQDEIIVDVPQGNLAATSGLARETVNRELHKLAKANLIRLTKQGIVVHIDRLKTRLPDDA